MNSPLLGSDTSPAAPARSWRGMSWLIAGAGLQRPDGIESRCIPATMLVDLMKIGSAQGFQARPRTGIPGAWVGVGGTIWLQDIEFGPGRIWAKC